MSLVKSVSKSLVAHIQRSGKITTPAMSAAMNIHAPMLRKVAPELPRFKDVLGTMRKDDFKINGMVVNEDAQAALGEFYLAIALRLHPERIDAAGEDNNLLLKVAFETAENDFEPWIAEARDFVANYDSQIHDDLKIIQAKYSNGEFCEGTFWSKFLNLIAEEEYNRIQEAAAEREATLTSHDAVDIFIASEASIQPDVAATRVALADSVLMDFQGDMRTLLGENGLLLLSEELQSAMDEHKKKHLL